MRRSSVSLGALGAVIALSAGASAEISFSIDVSNIVSPESPWATVEVWAHFDESQFAFAGAQFDVHTEADPGGLAVPQRTLHGPGTFDGDMSPDSDGVTGIVSGQIQFPPGGYLADTSNPVLVWRAKWTTWDFTPRIVDVATSTQKFWVFIDEAGNSEEFIDKGFAEGMSGIHVVPAPGTLALLAGSGMLCVGVRRRRRN